MFGDPEKYTSPPPQPKVTRVDAPISFRRSREVGRFAPKEAATITAIPPAARRPRVRDRPRERLVVVLRGIHARAHGLGQHQLVRDRAEVRHGRPRGVPESQAS